VQAHSSRNPAVEAEQSVIGALFLDNSAVSRINGLRPADFATEAHRAIFQAQLDCFEDGGVVDLTTVADRLERNGSGDKKHLVSYLSKIMQDTPSAANVARYAGLVREQAERRQLEQLGREIQERAARGDLEELRRDVTVRLDGFRRKSAAPCLDWRALSVETPPARRWAMRGWIGFGHASLLPGPAGIGKTLLSQQIASAFAIGRAFIDEVPSPFNVLCWYCEDDADELWRRQIPISKWLGAPLDSFADRLHIVSRVGLDNELVGVGYGRPLYAPLLDDLREQAEDLRAEVVILDNVAQLYGANENDRHQVTAFVNRLTGALPGRAIVLLAHPARSPGSEFSGSGAWEAACRMRLYLGDRLPDQKDDETPSGDVRYLARRKTNYSAKDWRRFTYRDGVLMPDAVETQGGIVGHIREQNAERIVLAGVRRLQAMGLTASDGKSSQRFLPRLVLEYKLGESNTKTELTAAMHRLMLSGKLRRTEVGKGADRHTIFGLEVTE
jgi:AAA domain-containing protein/DnaB helicase-like protein